MFMSHFYHCFGKALHARQNPGPDPAPAAVGYLDAVRAYSKKRGDCDDP